MGRWTEPASAALECSVSDCERRLSMPPARGFLVSMNAADVRASFREFAARDRYRKFVRSLHREGRRKGRLFYWQEQLWREFLSNVPGAPTSQGSILDTFRICDVHDCDLVPPPGNDPPPGNRHTPEYDHVQDSLFPIAAGGDLVCTQCQAARERWISDDSDLCRILRSRTTYEAYCERLFDGITDLAARDDVKRRAEDRFKERSIEIATQMEPGDELWEWDAGGWHHLAGRGGVAIVRGGKIVKQWCEIAGRKTMRSQCILFVTASWALQN